ncbi:MAG: hypothetical protein NTZ60_00895 [Campylobacterales bacterium]|nr:hypothetical protein [Campylobacterales bacterium]
MDDREVLVGISFLAIAIFVMANGFIKSIQIQRAIEAPLQEEVSSVVQEPEQLYEFQTHKIKYQIYHQWDLNDNDMRYLYHTIVLEQLWINEPFHSAFFKILLLLDTNDFMIVDPNSKVVTLNLRDVKNKMSTSKSYQVFSTKEIVANVFRRVLAKIFKFNKTDAQSITLSICIIALQKSTHYLVPTQQGDIVTDILSKHDGSKDIKHIISLINERDEQLLFIERAFEYALSYAQTYPYNDQGVKSTAIQMPSNLPHKVLQHI